MELKLEGITKSYTKGKKRKNALEDFSLTLTEGVYGLLGPNGAGKSTLINIITGIIGRDSGNISFTDGNDNSFLSHLGFMPQGMDFYRNFTAKDYIKYIMALKKYSRFDNARQSKSPCGCRQENRRFFRRNEAKTRHSTGYSRRTEGAYI